MTIIICQGTTPTLTWDIPYDASNLAAANVTVTQYGKIVIEKSLNDCHCNGKMLSVTLTQEETLALDHRCDAKIQATVRAIDAKTVRTFIDTVKVAEALKKVPV